MIDIELLRTNSEDVIQNLGRRGVDAAVVTTLLDLDQRWREATQIVEHLRAEQKQANIHMAGADVDKKQEEIDRLQELSHTLKEKAAAAESLKEERLAAWRAIPNLILDDVPDGEADAFEIVRRVPETIPTPTFSRQSYLDLGVPALIDTERASKVSGSRFAYIRGPLVRLQMALVSFAFDETDTAGFTPIIPPMLIGEQAMAGMGYLQHHAEEIYHTNDNLYLIGTSEQSIGPMHMEEVLVPNQLPLRYVGYSTCFRREAGSHGKDVKGIMRLHQFDKVEMFSFTEPTHSEEEHEYLLAQQENLMQKLELPYRVIKLASKDLGAPSAKTYDIETWIPSEETFRETHSTSNTTDYQARRLNIRVKGEHGTVKVHMLNGTALAIGRILIALIENHQQADGSIAIPKALHPYLPFTKIEV